MGYAHAASSPSKHHISQPRSFSRLSMRSRTFLIAVAFVCIFLLGRPFHQLQLRIPSDSPYSTGTVTEPSSDHRQEPLNLGNHGTISKWTQTDALPEVEGVLDAKIGKITMMYGDPNPTYERALRSHLAHAKAHGYPVFLLRQKLLGRLWSKPAYIMSVILQELQKPLEERLKWLFWFDADTFLINPKIPLGVFLPPDPEFSHISFLCGNDHHGLNDGAFLMRVSDWTLHLMAAAISVETFRPEVSLKYSEQSAIEHLVKEEPVYVNKTAIIPQRWYNAFMGPREWDGRVKPNHQLTGNSVVEGDLLVHFAGRGDTKKLRMTKFMDAYDKDKTAWQLELRDTEYEKEVEEFWQEWSQVESRRERGELVADDGQVGETHSTSEAEEGSLVAQNEDVDKRGAR